MSGSACSTGLNGRSYYTMAEAIIHYGIGRTSRAFSTPTVITLPKAVRKLSTSSARPLVVTLLASAGWMLASMPLQTVAHMRSVQQQYCFAPHTLPAKRMRTRDACRLQDAVQHRTVAGAGRAGGRQRRQKHYAPGNELAPLRPHPAVDRKCFNTVTFLAVHVCRRRRSQLACPGSQSAFSAII